MNKLLILLGIVTFSSATVANQSYEAGIGIPYGGALGFTINSELSSNTEVYGGLGISPDTLGYVIGVKFWLNEKARLSTNYGTNCFVKTGSKYNDYDGLNFGIGYAFNGRESGWAFDLILADISSCNDGASSNASDSSIKLAAGYRF